MGGDPSDLDGREVIIEIQKIGAAQRVAAVDVASGIEVVIQAPANAALADVRALAMKKLELALKGRTPPPAETGGNLV